MIDTAPPAIEIERLCKTFDHFAALDGIDLVARRGGIVGSLGHTQGVTRFAIIFSPAPQWRTPRFERSCGTPPRF